MGFLKFFSSIVLGLAISNPALARRSASTFTVTSPASGSTVSGTIMVQGRVGSTWKNVAIYNSDTFAKISGDVTPVNGSYSLPLDTTKLANGAIKIAVTAFSLPAGQLGGSSKEVVLSLTVKNASPSPTPTPSPSPSPSPSPNPSPVPTGCKDVTKSPYVAKGDGVTDNTSTLQNALKSGGCIYLPSVYNSKQAVYLSGPLTVPSGVTLTGGGTLRLKSGAGPLLSTAENASNVNIQSLSSETYRLTLDGNNRNPSDVLGLIEIDNAISNINVSNLTLQNIGGENAVGVQAVMSNGVTISGCSMDGKNSTLHGIEVWGGDSAVVNGATGASNITVSGNTFRNFAQAAAWGAAVANMNIVNNNASGCGDVCLDIEGGNGGSISGNTVANGVYGAITLFYASKNITIANNKITQGPQGTAPGLGEDSHGIKFFGVGTNTGIKVTGNTITCADTAGIFSDGTLGNSTISNNVINLGAGNTHEGIELYNDKGITLSNNTVNKH